MVCLGLFESEGVAYTEVWRLLQAAAAEARAALWVAGGRWGPRDPSVPSQGNLPYKLSHLIRTSKIFKTIIFSGGHHSNCLKIHIPDYRCGSDDLIKT
jgi:hypothetical protein